jgi:glycosyltransferase involved in cell wall biosynthesis
MKIAFNVQPLVSERKAGVGHAEDACLRALIGYHPEDEFFLEYFARFFPPKNAKIEKEAASVYLKNNVRLNVCNFFPNPAYRLISSLLPLPYRWFFKTNAEVSHFFNFIVPPFVTGKKVVTIHDMTFRRFPKTVKAKIKYMLKLSLRSSIKRADRIIAVSEFTKKEILNFYTYPEENIRVVYNGVDTQMYNASLREEKQGGIKAVCAKYGIKEAYALYLGTLEPRKNLERLIKAYALARERRADFPPLVLAGGEGWLYGSIFRTVKECHLENAVVFTGYVSREEKPLLLAGAEFFCFPSLYEGFGMPVLEAMACGTPVLTSNSSSLVEVAGDAALLVNAYSIEDMAGSLERLCFDKVLRHDLRKKGLERVRRFTWQNAAEQLYTIYKEAVDE